jgi:hypothetical protein
MSGVSAASSRLTSAARLASVMIRVLRGSGWLLAPSSWLTA